MKKYLPMVLFMFFSVSCTFFTPKDAWPYYDAKIVSVMDGDTIKVRFIDAVPLGCGPKEIVRLIGVDTPELSDPPEYYAQEAREYTNTYWHSRVTVEFDRETVRRDNCGRLLAYIHSSGSCINKKLIREGYGYYYDVFYFDKRKMFEFSEAERLARNEKKGIWQ